MMQVFMVLCFAFSVLHPYVAGETGCPPEEDIVPCTCFKYPQPRLWCRNILRKDEIDSVFEASKRYTYEEVRIEDSAFPYLPAEIFEKTAIKSLYMKDTTVSELIDQPVRAIPELVKIELETTTVVRGFTSQNFTLFTNLEEITVKLSPIVTISSKFGDLLPERIKYLRFSGNSIKKIGSGAFDKRPNLKSLYVNSNRLTRLERSIFPRPFNVLILNFDSNSLTHIPDYLFSDMPYLQYLSLKNNEITTIDEDVFSGRPSMVVSLRLEGNPLECDCGLMWITTDRKPEILGGNCAYPAELKGRSLESLNPSEISC